MTANINTSYLNPLKTATNLTENDGVPGSRFDADPGNYTVYQLKRWLKCRGLKVTGKRSELLARVQDCINAGNYRILDPSIDGGRWLDIKVSKEYSKDGKIIKEPKNKVPEIPTSGWKNFPSNDIPAQFNYGHVYFYALESLPSRSESEVVDQTSDDSDDEAKGHGLGHMTDKPFKNGRKYVDSGFVHDVTDNKNSDYYFLRAHVWPSMKTDLPHNVLIILSIQSGAVIHASCEPCKASELGRCSHVVAVLLLLLDHVKEHGHIVTTPCTSQECSWNKGKKRKKNPKRLSDAKYPSKKKKTQVQVIDFDPRPPQYRQVTSSMTNNFVSRLQYENAKTGKISMWTTQLKVSYNDYSVDDICLPLLREKVEILVKNLTPSSLTQLSDTEQQSQSEKWHSERWLRLTASKCLEAVKIGKLVLDGSKSAASRSAKFISSYKWNMESENYQSVWMARGLENEADAILKYQAQTKHQVVASGLWVNPKYPWLACSPDGLVEEDGLLEIKSLKVFHDHTIQSVIQESVLSQEVMKRQCFYIKDNECLLKHSHSYYYQTQMQLLVTERKYCDFVLYAKEGPVSAERIYRDESCISDILLSLTAFWTRVVAPEVFEMRIPRDLLPFVLSHDHTYASVSSSGSCSTNPTTCTSPGSTSYPTTCTSSGSTSYPTTCTSFSSTGYTTMFAASSTNLVILPWGCVTSGGISLTNTCPIDNWIMIFQSLAKSNRLNLDNVYGGGAIIKTSLHLLELHQYGDAKVAVIPQAAAQFNNSGDIDLYGNEADFFLPLLKSVLTTEFISTCGLPNCPSPVKIYRTCNINLSCCPGITTFQSAFHEWLNPSVSLCRRRFQNKPLTGIPCLQDTVTDCNGKQYLAWYCSGLRANSPRQFVCFNNVFVFCVDLLSRAGHLEWEDLPATLVINSTQLYLHSATLWNEGHYISIIIHHGTCYIYDGLKEHRNPHSGLSVFKASPMGYKLSHVIYAAAQ